MSMDRSLKTASSLSRHRNVLTRAERLAKLTDEERWEDGKSVFGLPKVSNRNVKVGKKEKKKDEAAEGAAAAPGAPAAAPAGKAPAGKAPAAAKAPAAGAKAAPAAKAKK
jgi:small basic protein (TIGR04137 family)